MTGFGTDWGTAAKVGDGEADKAVEVSRWGVVELGASAEKGCGKVEAALSGAFASAFGPF